MLQNIEQLAVINVRSYLAVQVVILEVIEQLGVVNVTNY
jgi:hypothetical protein